MTQKDTTSPICPKCSAKLFYDGKGLRCTKCLYIWRPDKKPVQPEDPPPAPGKDEQEP